MDIRKKSYSIFTAGFIINSCIGVFNVWSVFSNYFSTHGWTNLASTLPYSLAIATRTIAMLAGSWLILKYKPGTIFKLSALFLGMGLFISGYFLTQTAILIGFGLFSGLGIGLSYSIISPIVIKWFSPKLQGKVLGIIMSGFGAAALYTAPITIFMIDEVGINATFQILGLIYCVIIIACSFFFSAPANEERIIINSGIEELNANPLKERTFTHKELLSTPEMRKIWCVEFGIGLSGLLVVGHAMKILISVGFVWGALVLPLMAVGNIFGRSFSGVCIDILGRKRTALLFYGGSSAALLYMAFTENPILMLLLIIIVNASYGSTSTINPTICGDVYGRENIGGAYSLAFIVWGAGGIIGPTLGGYLYDITGSFQTTFLLASFITAISAYFASTVDKNISLKQFTSLEI